MQEPIAVLFTPANTKRRMEKAITLHPDAVIFDLEDGVPADQKQLARQNVMDILNDSNTDVPVYVRINAMDSSEYRDDIAFVQQLSIKGVMLAKADLKATEMTVSELPDRFDFVPLIETAKGVMESYQMGLIPNVTRLAFGSVDYANDLGVQWTPDGKERLGAMQQLIISSRASDCLAPWDAVYPNIEDKNRFQSDAALGKTMGFSGKLVIHPAQIDWIRETYQPTEEEIEWAQSVVEADRMARAEGRAVVAMRGELVDLPVLKIAMRICTLANVERQSETS